MRQPIENSGSAIRRFWIHRFECRSYSVLLNINNVDDWVGPASTRQPLYERTSFNGCGFGHRDSLNCTSFTAHDDSLDNARCNVQLLLGMEKRINEATPSDELPSSLNELLRPRDRDSVVDLNGPPNGTSKDAVLGNL